MPSIKADYARRGLGRGLAISSLVIGSFSLIAGLFTPFAALGALIGVALGVMALVCGHRGLAVAGIVLCCLAVTISGIRLSWATGNYLTSPAGEEAGEI